MEQDQHAFSPPMSPNETEFDENEDILSAKPKLESQTPKTKHPLSQTLNRSLNSTKSRKTSPKTVQLAWNFRHSNFPFKKPDPLEESMQNLYEDFKGQNEDFLKRKKLLRQVQDKFQINQQALIVQSLKTRYEKLLV